MVIEKLNNDILIKDDEIKDKQTTMDSLEEDYKKNKALLQEETLRLSESKFKNSKLESKITELEALINKLQKGSDSSMNQLSVENKELKDQLEDSHTNLKNLEEKLDKLEKESSEEISKLKEDNNKNEKFVEDAITNHNLQEKEIEILKQEKEELQKQLDEIKLKMSENNISQDKKEKKPIEEEKEKFPEFVSGETDIKKYVIK